MPILDEKTKKIVLDEFQKLKEQVRLIFFTQEIECNFCAEAKSVISQVAELSDKIKLEIYNYQLDKPEVEKYKIEQIPALVILAGDHDFGFRFYGTPMGYEFTVLIQMIIIASQRDSGLQPKTRELLKKIDNDLELKIFVTPTCPYCPRAGVSAGRFAYENNLIKVSIIETAEFPHLVQKYNVMGVPKILVNEKIEFTGSLPEPAFAQHLIHSLEHLKGNVSAGAQTEHT